MKKKRRRGTSFYVAFLLFSSGTLLVTASSFFRQVPFDIFFRLGILLVALGLDRVGAGILHAIVFHLLLRREAGNGLGDGLKWRASGWVFMVWLRLCACLVGRGAAVRMRQVDVWRWRRELALRIEKSRLEVDNVLSQGVVFGLDLLVGLIHVAKLADLLLELLDVFFLALAECALSGSVLRRAFGLGELPLGPVAFAAVVLSRRGWGRGQWCLRRAWYRDRAMLWLGGHGHHVCAGRGVLVLVATEIRVDVRLCARLEANGAGGVLRSEVEVLVAVG